MKAQNPLHLIPIVLGVIIVVLLSTIVYFSSESPASPRGFRLPDGDPIAGRAAFEKIGCVSCHTVIGIKDFDQPETESLIRVSLGGKVSRVKTYGQLVTSIINPSHVVSRYYQGRYTDPDGKSLMPDLTEQMSARELIDLVAFLQPKYQIMAPEHPYEHPYYRN